MFEKSPEEVIQSAVADASEQPDTSVESVQTQGNGAVIGESICIKGEVSGQEALTINGRVEGSIDLRDHNLRIGKAGQINANMVANEVRIDGLVNGDITGVEKVIVSSVGRVQGNIVAPRVTLEDGAKFKGSIDMDPSEKVPALPPVLGTADLAAPAKTESAQQVLQQVRRGKAAAKTTASSIGKRG